MLAYIGWWLLLAFLGILFVLLVAAGLIALVLPSMILRASCSVADVKEPRYLISFPLGYGAVAAYAVLSMAFVTFLGRVDLDPEAPFGSMHMCGYLLSLAVGWILASLVYRLILAPSFWKGFWVAGLQVLLHGLASGLISGVLLTTLAVWQLLGFQLPWSNARPKPASAEAVPALVAVDRS
jgi:hypothetical protein